MGSSRLCVPPDPNPRRAHPSERGRVAPTRCLGLTDDKARSPARAQGVPPIASQAQQPPKPPPPKGDKADKGPVVGIDLGTTYSCVAVCQAGAGRIEIIANADGSRTTPSWVAFSQQDGTRHVGQGAKNQAAANPENTINDAKRLIGRPWHDDGLQRDLPNLSYRVEEVSSCWAVPGRDYPHPPRSVHMESAHGARIPPQIPPRIGHGSHHGSRPGSRPGSRRTQGADNKPMIKVSSNAWDKPRGYAPEQIR